MPKGEVGQRQGHDRIDRPGMHAPMEEGDAHRLARRFHRLRVTDGWRHVVHHRFRHAKEHQADPHAGRKQHREPGGVGVIRLAVIRPQPDAAKARQRERDHEDDESGHRQDVEPAHRFRDPTLHGAEQDSRRPGEEGGKQDEGEGQDSGNDEDGWTDLYAGVSLSACYGPATGFHLFLDLLGWGFADPLLQHEPRVASKRVPHVGLGPPGPVCGGFRADSHPSNEWWGLELAAFCPILIT